MGGFKLQGEPQEGKLLESRFLWENPSSFTDNSHCFSSLPSLVVSHRKGPEGISGRSSELGLSMDSRLWGLVLLPILLIQRGSILAAGEGNSIWALFP